MPPINAIFIKKTRNFIRKINVFNCETHFGGIEMSIGFGMGFGLFQTMFSVVFIIVIGMFIVTAVKGIST